MKKRLSLLAGLLCLLLLGGYLLLWLTAPRISHANFERIEVGMGLAEVEELLGRPADRDTRFDLVAEVPPEEVPYGTVGREGYAEARYVGFVIENLLRQKPPYRDHLWSSHRGLSERGSGSARKMGSKLLLRCDAPPHISRLVRAIGFLFSPRLTGLSG
jgi:hypothetical protein